MEDKIQSFSIIEDDRIKKIIKMWEPYIVSYFKQQDVIIKLFCIYTDYIRINFPNDIQATHVKIAADKLSKLELRFEVVRTDYNVMTKTIEYTLSNGMKIPNTDSNTIYIPISDMIEIFGTDFMKKEFLVEYRDYVINNLTNG